MTVQIDQRVLEAAQSFVARAAERFDVKSAAVFGSRARNEGHTFSDVDVALFLNGKPGDFADTKLALADLAYDILLEQDLLIDPLPVWEEERRAPANYRNPGLLKNIERDGILL
jgi:predicted nucleotidyltransferase